MAKQAYVYSGTDWVPLASEVTNLSGYYTKGEVDTSFQTKATTGLVLLNTTSFSGVASTSLATNTFTSTYTNYKILWRVTAATVDANFFIRLRASGSDLGSAEATLPDNFRYFMDIDLSEPYVADYTSIKHTSAGCDGSSNYTGQSGGGFHSIKTAYDSASLHVESGNMTGFYSVYGYKK